MLTEEQKKPKAVLISTYELGRQPFGLGSAAAWLERAGADVRCLDLSCEALDEAAVQSADFIAFYVPMHTATRLALKVLPTVQRLSPKAHICFYGLYAPVNEGHLRSLGVRTVTGGEFEGSLVQALLRKNGDESGERAPVISLERQTFITPDRGGLPILSRYAQLVEPDGGKRLAGYTEASRGCKHLCRHCPIVPVYNGRFRIVQPEVVLADIRQQVAAGARHITFGDPDFFNGIRHAMRIVTAMHREFPEVTYDATIKIEHLLKHADGLATLRETGCVLVTSAVESLDDAVLAKLDKGHTCEDFYHVLELFRETGLALAPTFIAFTPWTTLESYCDFLLRLHELGLAGQVAPVQLAIRLLIPAGSRLLELAEVREMIGEFDQQALVYKWSNRDPRVDELCAKVHATVHQGSQQKMARTAIFDQILRLAYETAGMTAPDLFESRDRLDRAAIPYLTEPWYC